MGFVRKRPSKTRGTRYQSVALLDGRQVELGTFESFSVATDAWQHAETAARRGLPGGDPRAARRPFADVAEEYLATQQLAASTRKSCTSLVRTHLIPRLRAVPIADVSPAMLGAWLSDCRSVRCAGRRRPARRAVSVAGGPGRRVLHAAPAGCRGPAAADCHASVSPRVVSRVAAPRR